MPHVFKAHPDHPIVDYLVRLHADLAGKIQQSHIVLEHLQENVRHVEAVIQMFDPDFNLKQIAPRRRQKQNAFFKRGTIFRRVVDVVRAATKPMTVAEISDVVLHNAKIKNPTDTELVGIHDAIRASLEANNGKTVQRAGEGMPRRWQMMAI